MHSWAFFGKLTVGLLWLGWAGYWIAAARQTLLNRHTETLLTGASYRILLALGVILMASPGRYLSDFKLLLWPQSSFTVGLGVSLTMCGLSVAIWARRHLGQYWSARIVLKLNHRIVQSGPYSIIRHPIYSGLLLALLGAVICIGSIQSCVGLIIIFVSCARKATLEERWLSAHLGQEYERYRHSVKAFIPYLI